MSNKINDIRVNTPTSEIQDLKTKNQNQYTAKLPQMENDSFCRKEEKSSKSKYVIGGLIAAAVTALAIWKHKKVKNPVTPPSMPQKQLTNSDVPQTHQKPILPPKTPPTVNTTAENLAKLHLPESFADCKITDEEFFRKMNVLQKQLIEHYKSLGDMKKVKRLEELVLTIPSNAPDYTRGRLEILEALYDNLRKTSYSVEETIVSKNIDEITASTNRYIKNVEGNSWNYRYHECANYSITRRYSVNAKGDQKLIILLDRFMAENKIKGYYKTPKTSEGWCTRHDPITIYLEEPLSPELEHELVTIVNPFIRSKNNVLIGEKVRPGLSKDFEPTREQTIALYEAIKKINPRMARYLLGNERNFRHPTSPWSAGQLKNVVDYVKFMTSPQDYNIFEAAKIV